MTQLQRTDSDEGSRILVRELNPMITCKLCEGYLIDATTLIDCLHCFCRACILRYFENSKIGCPICNTVYKKKSHLCFRSDSQIQSMVYKLVPSLYSREIQRREDFYRSTGVRASSSCSDDSVIDRERDMINEQEKMISRCVGDRNQFLGQDDPISLSLEYYQVHLDTTDVNKKPTPPSQIFSTNAATEPVNLETSEDPNSGKVNNLENSDSACLISEVKSEHCKVNSKVDNENEHDSHSVENDSKDCDKRYLQCPAAVSMKHLQKFIRMKFGLTGDHRVDIIYKGEVLSKNFSLIDVAYIFKWKRVKPMRFFYRIFTPMKVRPIKIVNTTLSTGGKQLQIVPLKSFSDTQRHNDFDKAKEKEKQNKTNPPQNFSDHTEDQKKELFAHLQLQSKNQIIKERELSNDESEKNQSKECIFEYEEPEEEFAEKRDREWALQKKLDESRKREEEEQYSLHHFSKKRKKNKHSKNEFNQHKKRKLHAEIASNDAELKLKVKITNNGHKHKHHKSSAQISDKASESSSKEKLLQMRQIRHKHVTSEDKNIQTLPNMKYTSTNEIEDDIKKLDALGESSEEVKKCDKPLEDIKKLKIKVSEPSSKALETAVLPKHPIETLNASPKVVNYPDSSSAKGSLIVNAVTAEKDWNKKVPTVHIERNEQTEKQARVVFLEPPSVNNEKVQKFERKQPKDEEIKVKKLNNLGKSNYKADHRADNNKIKINNKLLNRQMASLQQQCTIEPKKLENIDKRVENSNEKSKFFTPHYPPGFTVSKVEQGVKRKVEDDDGINDKRPSLEITLINPPNAISPIQSSKIAEKSVVKRPPPATIPLEKIKKSVHLKSAGISIIPKMSSEKCDNIGALDLSKPSTKPVEITTKSLSAPNGFSITPNRQLSVSSKSTAATSEKNNLSLSNLHMLSKVATEHSIINKTASISNTPTNKTRPQIPNLQTIKIPSPQNQINKVTNTNVQKMPKLNEITKFRPNMPIRCVRPNQNQNIRNIPNPSLLIRQQNQNRLNSQINTQQHNNNDNSIKTVSDATAVSPSVQKESNATINTLKIMDPKLQEKKEISV